MTIFAVRDTAAAPQQCQWHMAGKWSYQALYTEMCMPCDINVAYFKMTDQGETVICIFNFLPIIIWLLIGQQIAKVEVLIIKKDIG